MRGTACRPSCGRAFGIATWSIPPRNLGVVTSPTSRMACAANCHPRVEASVAARAGLLQQGKYMDEMRNGIWNRHPYTNFKFNGEELWQPVHAPPRSLHEAPPRTASCED